MSIAEGKESPLTDNPHSRPRMNALTAAAVAIAVAAVPLSVAGAYGAVVVTAGAVIPLWTAGLFVAVITLLLGVSSALRSRRMSERKQRRRSPTQLVTSAALVIGLCAAALAAFGGMRAGGSVYTILSPEGASGCRIAVAESTSFLEGHAVVYSLPPGPFAVATPHATLRVDGGGEPFARDLAVVEWDSASSARIDAPGVPHPIRLTCA